MLKYGKIIYPQSLDDNSPKNYFLALFVGSRGSGKTYLICKLLKTLERKKIYDNNKEVPQRIILICSTAYSDSNKVFKTLKNLNWDNGDVITEYNDDLLKEKMDELKIDLDEAKDYKAYKLAFKKFKIIDNVDDLTQEEMIILNKYNFQEIKDIPKPDYPNGFVIHWIIDDMLGQNIFKQGRSAFTNLCIRNRHIIPGNIIISSQQIMGIPKTIRANSNLLVLFKFANKRLILDDLYPTFSGYITEKQFESLYDFSTNDPHDALVIDATGSKLIFKKNFNKLLTINSEEG